MINIRKVAYTKHPNGKWAPVTDCYWECGWQGSGLRVEIKAGTLFDSSVPKLLTWLVSRDHPAWLPAALIHDELLKRYPDRSFAAGEWFRAARSMAKRDSKRKLVAPAYYAVVLWTVK